jgi:hypothetical protein
MFHEYCNIDTTVTPWVHPKKLSLSPLHNPRVLCALTCKTFIELIHPLRVGWRNFFPLSEKFLQPIHALRVYGMVHGARIWLVIQVSITISDFLRIFLLNPNFLLAHRNRYLEVTNDGQITPHGYVKFKGK